MIDLIELKLVTEGEAECLHRLQVEAFMPLYEKYQDDDTSPAKESLERVTEKIIEDNSDFYFIVFHGEKVGGVRVRWHQGKKVYENINWISPIFIIPKWQNKGIASTVIEKLFNIYPDTIEWRLATIKQEAGNCHLYEKMDFVKEGKDIMVNEKMTLVHYIKNCVKVRRFEEKDVDCQYGHLYLQGGKMNIIPYSNKIDDYLKEDEVIDFTNQSIVQLADKLYGNINNDVEYIKRAYEYVRDNVSHSADINEDMITCVASEVLKAGHGICFAKSHLLSALLRCKSIPTGFCYQKISLNEETTPILVYHGLNGVYIKELKKWIRLDARGNKNGVNAQFSIETEQLAYPIRVEKGEEDDFTVYPNPDIKIIGKLKQNKTRTQLWNNLPTELGYKKIKE